jgi:hypothetical protein
MKKVILFAAVCAMFAACKDGKNASVAPATDSVAADSAVYSGLVPSADGAGIRYRLAVANDSTNGYSLEEAYMKSDTEVDTLLNYQGKLDKFTSKEGKHYYQLNTQTEKHAYNFLVVNDSTLRLVSSELEESVNKDMNYDLKLQ